MLKMWFSKRFYCDLCEASFTLQGNLTKHVAYAHSENPKQKFTCDLCGFSVKYLERHIMEKHQPDNKIKYPCGACEKTYLSRRALRTHTQWAHEDNNPTCDVCGKLVRNLRKHNQEVHEANDRLPCDICNKTFAATRSLV